MTKTNGGGSDFEATLRSVDEVVIQKGVVAVVYGESGSGKTSLLRTLPGPRTVVYDVDGGMDPLRGWQGRVVQATRDLANLKPFVEWATTAKHSYSTIVVDSVSLLERRMVFAYGEARGKDLIDVKEYGDAAVKLRHYLIQLRDLSAKGVNVVFVAHVKSDVKGREGTRAPFLSDKLACEIVGLVDLCGYLAVSPDGSRSLTFAPAPNLMTKTRYSCVGSGEPLDLSAIIAKVYAAQGRGAKREPMPVIEPVASITQA